MLEIIRDSPTRWSEMLDDISAFVRRYVALPDDSLAGVMAGWIAHTWLAAAFDNTPRLAFTSAEAGSGKSRALEIVEALSYQPMLALNATPAAVFRTIDRGPVTLLLDEIDTIFGNGGTEGSEALRGILNAGYRRGATVPRVEGTGTGARSVHHYQVFAPVALAGLGRLPNTISTRSIIVRMRRRRDDEVVAPFRRREAQEEIDRLVTELSAFADAMTDTARTVTPAIPPTVTDRDADVWEPLMIVAELAGGPWPSRIRTAATSYVASRSSRDGTIGVALLRDVRQVLGQRTHISSNQLVEELLELEDSRWVDLDGRALTTTRLANLLEPYGVHPHQHRVGGVKKRGYTLSGEGGLADPFARYLSPEDDG